MKHFNLPREPLVLGLVLGTMAESELARALALVQGDIALENILKPNLHDSNRLNSLFHHSLTIQKKESFSQAV